MVNFLLKKLGDVLEKRLISWGLSAQWRELVWHWMDLTWNTAVAVVPITLLLLAALGILFRETATGQGSLWGGLVSATMGLVLFLEGLRIAVMPLGEMLGKRLPERFPRWVVLIVAFCLGVLVTYAEPAITSIRPLALLVNPETAPYLYFAMNTKQELLVMSIGIGVGVAAVVGTLRFVYDWSIKPCIVAVSIPTFALACYMQWGNTDLKPLIGIAWDCGAVTTGPVTVPILLSVGIGVADTARRQMVAKNPSLKTKEKDNELRGFGIVTLASLFPILAVELMAILMSVQYSYDEVIAAARAGALKGAADGPADKSPVREVVFGIRSIMPLNVFLILLVVGLLREPLPDLTIFMTPPPAETDVTTTIQKQDIAEGGLQVGEDTASRQGPKPDSPAADTSTGQAVNQEDSPIAPYVMGSRPVLFSPAWWAKNRPLMVGIGMCQVGMICFNFGSTYAFTQISGQAGRLLPGAYKELPGVDNTPYYSYVGGIWLLMLVTFLLGYLATCAEPALQILGITLERLSKGRFTKSMLVGAVAVGVGSGLALGAVKILFAIDLLYLLFGGYAVVFVITYLTPQDICSFAWDSAGVTTGPVTVPYVLALGIGYSTAVGAVEGFGMLSTASVMPILTVLGTNLLTKPVQDLWAALTKRSKKAPRTLSKSNRVVSPLPTLSPGSRASSPLLGPSSESTASGPHETNKPAWAENPLSNGSISLLAPPQDQGILSTGRPAQSISAAGSILGTDQRSTASMTFVDQHTQPSLVSAGSRGSARLLLPPMYASNTGIPTRQAAEPFLPAPANP